MRIFQKGTGALLAGIVLMLAALVPSIASAQSVEDIIARGKLIVAIDTTTPPYGFLDADLKPTGFDIEVANKMGEALGVPVDVPEDGDFGAAFGAARLGLIAATGADALSVCAAPATEATIEPNAALSDAYEDAYRRYRALYPAIKEVPSKG